MSFVKEIRLELYHKHNPESHECYHRHHRRRHNHHHFIIITITKYLCLSLCGILDIYQLRVGRKSLMEEHEKRP